MIAKQEPAVEQTAIQGERPAIRSLAVQNAKLFNTQVFQTRAGVAVGDAESELGSILRAGESLINLTLYSIEDKHERWQVAQAAAYLLAFASTLQTSIDVALNGSGPINSAKAGH